MSTLNPELAALLEGIVSGGTIISPGGIQLDDGEKLEFGNQQDYSVFFNGAEVVAEDENDVTLHTIDVGNGDITFEKAADDPSFLTHDHTESSLSQIPNAGLVNDSITLNAGNALSGGGSVSLGGSVSVAVSLNGIAEDELDLGITPTWTGQHTFGAGLRVNDNDLLSFGSSEDYWAVYDSAQTAFRFRSTDVDGGGSNGTIYQIQNGTQDVEFLGDISFPNVTGTPSFTSHDHSEAGLAQVPNAGLVNSSVTITSGDGLSGGGSLSLGGSLTLDIVVSDFAGAGMSDDGSNNLDVNVGNGLEIVLDNVAIETDAIQLNELDTAISPTWTGTHTFNGNVTMGTDVDYQTSFLPINLPAPVNDNDAARKIYVDSVAQGLVVKDSVRAASTTNIDLTSATDPNPVDGVNLNDGDRVLLKDQTDATENGIYDAVTATDPTTWVRSADADEDSEVVSGTLVFVEEGTNNGSASFIITTEDPITVGSTAITWSIFARAGEIQAGDGLAKSGQTLSIATDGVALRELDESIAPTWTSQHTFNAGVSIPVNTTSSINNIDISDDGSDNPILDFQGNPNFQRFGTTYLEFFASPARLDLGNVDIRAGTGTTIWDHSNDWIPSAALEVDSVTITAGDGLKNGGGVSLGGSVTLDIEPADFAGAGLQDDGADNLELVNDSVTITAGDGLKDGGSVSLGGSVTLNIEPADFAGTFLSDDGVDNLTVDIGDGLEDDGVGNIRVDEDFDFTFTSAIDFSAGLDTQGNITDGAQIIWDATGQEIPDSAMGTIENSTLANDSVTITAGDGLKNGGSVALGSSVTLDIEPADFAGVFLSDDGTDNLTVDIGNGLENDGSDNIRVNPGAIAGNGLTEDTTTTLGIATGGVGTDELDETVTYTFTNTEIFSRTQPGSGRSIAVRVRNATSSDQFNFGITSGGLFRLDVFDASATTTRNIYEIDPASQQMDMLATLNFPNITGTPTFASHDHSEGGMSTIPNAGLTNSSITVTAGDGLKNGGSVSLGSSVTLDIEPADFAGTFLSDDGADDLTVDIGFGLENDGVGNIRLDEDIAPTWTADHEFQATISMTGGTSEILDLNNSVALIDPQYIEFGTSDALFSSSPNPSASTIHNADPNGSSYPYNAGFETLVIQGRDDRGDVAIVNGDGSNNLVPFYAARLGGSNEFWRNLSMRQNSIINSGEIEIDPSSSGLTDGGNINSDPLRFRGYYDSDATAGITAEDITGAISLVVDSDGTSDLRFNIEGSTYVRLDSTGTLFLDQGGINLDHNNNPAINDVQDVRWSRSQWGGSDVSISAEGGSYAAGWIELSTDVGEVLRIDQDNDRFQFSQYDIVDGAANVIFDQSNNWVPLSILQADTVTVTAGDGLKNGGSVQLGSSITINIEPADFAGSFLSDDGADDLQVDIGNGLEDDGAGNIRVNPGAIAGNGLTEDTTTTIGIATDGVQTDEIDLSISPTWTGTHTFNGSVTMGTDVDYGSSFLPINLPAPVNDGDAARKGYVDGVAQGLNLKESVRAATNGVNVDLTSATDPNPIDGVTLSNGDRVLLKDQTTGSENGIYIANTATDPTTWTRSPDFDEDSEVTSGAFTFVEEGTNNGDSSWIVTTDDPITVGSTSITFSQFAAAGEITAGDGLNKSGQTLSVDVSDFAGTFLSDDGSENLQVDIGTGLENDGSDNIRVDEDFDFTFTSAIDFSAGLDTQGNITDGAQVIWDVSAQEIPDSAMGSIDNSTLTNSSVTVTAGDGLKDGGSVSLGGSITINIEPADFAGAGLQDDGADNLELVNDSVTVTAGDGLKNGGTVALGGSITIDIEPADFAGSGLQDDGADNLELVNDSVTVTAGTDLNGGGTVALGGSITINLDQQLDQQLRLAGTSGNSATGSAGDGEFYREVGSASDFIHHIQGGHGRVAKAWNAYWNDTNTQWESSAASEPHGLIAFLGSNPGPGVATGTVILGTAGTNASAGDAVTWSTVTLDDSGEFSVDDGGITAQAPSTIGSIDFETGAWIDLQDNGGIRRFGTDYLTFFGSPNRVDFNNSEIRSVNDIIGNTGTTIWDNSNDYIPQAALQNDSLTVTAGGGLSGGGSVSLGGSVTLNVDTGRGVELDTFQALQLDEDVAAVWTSGHTFQSGITLTGGDVLIDHAAGALDIQSAVSEIIQLRPDDADTGSLAKSIAWYADGDNPTTRSAFVGFGSGTDDDFNINNELGSNILVQGAAVDIQDGQVTLYDGTEITDGSGLGTSLGPGSTSGTILKGSPSGHVSVDIRANNDQDSFQVRYDSSLSASEADTRIFRADAQGIVFVEGSGGLQVTSGSVTFSGGGLTLSGGNLNMSSNIVNNIDELQLDDAAADGRVWTISEDGAGRLLIEDDTSATLRMNSGTQEVQLIGGDLLDNADNILYDQSNAWVPQERVEQGSGSGLDADTVDGQEASALGGFGDDDIATDSSGIVQNGEVGVMHITSVPNGSSLNITQAALLLSDGQAAPSNLDLIIGTMDNTGSGTSEVNIITGDGTTVYDDQTGSPLASYTNNSGSAQTVFIGIDNGQFNTGTGSNQEIFATAIGSVV